MRGVVAGGIALTARVRRPTTPNHSAAAPRKPRAPRRPRAATPVPPANPRRPSWFARWFAPRRALSAWFCRESYPDNNHLHFTPEAFPGLDAKACAILNTPLEDCDPETVRLLLAALAEHIAASLPPELGMTDAKAVFSTLWSHLGTPQTEVPPDAASDATLNVPPAMEPDPAPAAMKAAADASPDVLPAAEPSQAMDAMNAAPDVPPATEQDPAAAAQNPVADASPAAPAAPLHAQPTPPANDATHLARETTPAITRTAPTFPGRSMAEAGLSLPRHRRAPIHRRHQRPHRGLRNTPKTPPPRRLCYAACAGPP